MWPGSIVLCAAVLSSAALVRASDTPPPACSASSKDNPSPIRVVAPTFPAAAIDARVQGLVSVALEVAQSGSVAAATACRDIPALTAACSRAAKQWKFQAAEMSAPRLALVTCRFLLDDADSDPVTYLAPGDLEIHGRAPRPRPIE
jgi:outer membrane biosynthesis protein TonB